MDTTQQPNASTQDDLGALLTSAAPPRPDADEARVAGLARAMARAATASCLS